MTAMKLSVQVRGDPNLSFQFSVQIFENPPRSSEIQKDRSIAVLLSRLMDCSTICAVLVLNSIIIHRSDAGMRQPDQIRDAWGLLPKNG